MSVGGDSDNDNAATTTTSPAAKRKSSEVIRDQHDGSESSEQKRIRTSTGEHQDVDSSEQEDIRQTGRRSPRRGTVSNWLLFMMPTFDLPSTNPPNSYDHQQTRYIVRKTLYEADLSLGQARLLLTRTEMRPLLPLSEFLTPAEDNAVHNGEGLPVRAFDWRGREYGMVFKFLDKTRAYRLIKQWGEFLRVNKSEMSAGNVIETTWYRRARNDGYGEVCVDLWYVGVEMHERKAAAAPVCKNVLKREEPIKHKIKRIKIKHAQNHELVVAATVAEQQQIVSVEPEFPTADELLVAEALLLLHVRR